MYPWFHRGGGNDYGTDSSVFAFGHTHGSNENIVSFRTILTP